MEINSIMYSKYVPESRAKEEAGALRAESEWCVPDELKNVVTQHVMTHMVGTYFKPAKYGNEVVEICVKSGRMDSRETKTTGRTQLMLSREAI